MMILADRISSCVAALDAMLTGVWWLQDVEAALSSHPTRKDMCVVSCITAVYRLGLYLIVLIFFLIAVDFVALSVLVGLESHVCCLQTVAGLTNRGVSRPAQSPWHPKTRS